MVLLLVVGSSMVVLGIFIYYLNQWNGQRGSTFLDEECVLVSISSSMEDHGRHALSRPIRMNKNCAAPDEAWAQSMAQMYIESQHEWLDPILTRVGRQGGEQWHFLVQKEKARPQNNDKPLLLSISPCEEEESWILQTHDSHLRMVRSILISMQEHHHLHLMKVHAVDYFPSATNAEDAIVVLTEFTLNGSLKDLIYHHRGPHNKKSTRKKYKKKVRGRALAPRFIAQYGRDILTAMLALDQVGLPVYFLTSADIILCPEGAKLTNYENALLPCRPNYKLNELIHRLRLSDKVAPHVSMEVIVFGLIVFEMAYGKELSITEGGLINYHKSAKYQRPSAPVEQILDVIFSPTHSSTTTTSSLDQEATSLEYLLTLPLFNSNSALKTSEECAPVHLMTEQAEFIQECRTRYEEMLIKGPPAKYRKRKVGDKNMSSAGSKRGRSTSQMKYVPKVMQGY